VGGGIADISYAQGTRQANRETLSGGEQQMLAIARGLMSHPKLLMLDEMSLGLMPTMVEKNDGDGHRHQQRRDHGPAGRTDGPGALEIAHRGYVIQSGNIVQSGTGRELLDSPDVRKAYLGM
jgi:branched-chain amino acid transport system ATP-binding protein